MNGLAVKTDPPSALSAKPPTGINQESLKRRFWGKVDKKGPDECWLWTASKTDDGYGKLGKGTKYGGWEHAHIVAYRLMIGEIPIGLELDHLCQNPSCVNPKHLEPVTHRTNLLRGNGLPSRNARATHCPQGHPYDLLNTYYYPDGHRGCRECNRFKQREGYRGHHRQPVKA